MQFAEVANVKHVLISDLPVWHIGTSIELCVVCKGVHKGKQPCRGQPRSKQKHKQGHIIPQMPPELGHD